MSATAAVEVFARVGCALGEGPIWCAERTSVLWVDLEVGHVWESSLAGDARVIVERDEPIGAIALGQGGELLGFTPSGLWRLDGTPTLLVPAPEPDPALRANDGKPDPAGRFVGGTMGRTWPVGPVGTLWSYAGGTAQPLRRGTTVSNGLAWTADTTTMYWADSGTRAITAFPYDVASGAIGEARPFVVVDGDDRGPDGITIDADDCVWVAVWGGGCLHRYAPDGELLDVVELPVAHPTCPVFAGPDLDVLLVTSAYAPGRNPQVTGAGDVFALRPRVGGRPPWRVDLSLLLG